SAPSRSRTSVTTVIIGSLLLAAGIVIGAPRSAGPQPRDGLRRALPHARVSPRRLSAPKSHRTRYARPRCRRGPPPHHPPPPPPPRPPRAPLVPHELRPGPCQEPVRPPLERHVAQNALDLRRLSVLFFDVRHAPRMRALGVVAPVLLLRGIEMDARRFERRLATTYRVHVEG